MQVSEAIISAWVRHVKNLQRSLSHFFLYIKHMHSLRDQKQMCRDLFCHCPLNCSALVQVSQRRLWSTASASWASAWASRRGSQSALTRDDALRTCPARALCTNASSSASSSSFILRVEILDAARFSPSALQPSSPGAPARPGRLCSVLASSPSASLLVLPCRRRCGGPRRDRTAPPRVPSRRRAPARRSGAAAARSGRRAWTQLLPRALVHLWMHLSRKSNPRTVVRLRIWSGKREVRWSSLIHSTNPRTYSEVSVDGSVKMSCSGRAPWNWNIILGEVN